MILLPFLLLTALGTAMLSPFVAAHLVLLRGRNARAPLTNWMGMTIGFEVGIAFLLVVLAVGIYGPTEWPYYRVALGFALPAPTLGFALIRIHGRRLRGMEGPAKAEAAACRVLALTAALALLPWVLGAPLPFGGGWFEIRPARAATVGNYDAVVLPLALVLEMEARWLAHGAAGPGLRPRFALHPITAVLLALLVAATLILPRSRLSSRNLARREREAECAQAERLEQDRRRALAEIVAGRAPRLLDLPCPSLPDAWRDLDRWAAPPATWARVAAQAEAWRARNDVTAWEPAPGPADRGSPQLAGPLYRFVRARLDEQRWSGPWRERDVLVPPLEVRRRVRETTRSAPWTLDATLVLKRELPTFASYGTTTLGAADGSLWLYDYRVPAFVCAGQVRIARAELEGMMSDAQASIARDAVRMRALAVAAANLHVVERAP